MRDNHARKNVEYYNKTAASFDASHAFSRENRNHLKKIHKIIELMEVKKGDSILEIGVGTGIHAKRLLELKDVKYTGIDITEAMILEAQKRLEQFDDYNLLVADAENLPYKTDTFDKIFCSGSLHHVPHPEKAIKEAVRVLKRGGVLVLMEPNKYFILNYLAAKFIEIEKNILLMKRENFYSWAEGNELDVFDASYFIYTPPFPRFMTKSYDLIDKLMKKVPLLKKMSIMIYVAARKR